jgi:hypothetical protein
VVLVFQLGGRKLMFPCVFEGYMKAVKAKLKELNKTDAEIKEFETGAQKYFLDVIMPKFSDWEFYTGESMSAEGMVVLLDYREDGTTPYVVIWKHGVKGEKV